MKTKILIVTTMITLVRVFSTNAQKKLNKFGNSREKKIGFKTIKVPYTNY